uniref:Anaphase-promoting complex subunit 4 WD40 domain-containing protein n=1 Tax=Compsopogon caeruleus TaxID=31354 RepID=A0A7S1TFP0_9RHOD|mmetsp:Transcript_5110/g.10365  ORF Transcript_5110/g.10365 Transcript_5110/m.10365 type:complete len:318 (+) Transcript_5110:327-1280(+)
MDSGLPARPVPCGASLHTGAVHAVRFNSSGKYCVSGGADRQVLLLNPSKGLILKSYVGHGYPVLDVTISHDDRHIVSSGMDKLVFYWDVMSGVLVRRFGGTRDGGHTQRVNAVAAGSASMNPSDLMCQVIASASYDKSVRLWDPRSNNVDPIQVLEDARDSVTSVSFRGTDILTTSVDERLRIYDIRMARIFEDWLGIPLGFGAVSGDGNCILTTCLDSQMRMVERSSGDILSTYSGHVNESFLVRCAFTFDDAFVVCGSEDGKVYCWDLENATETPTKTLSTVKDEGSVACGAIDTHPSLPQILSGSHSGHIMLWT